MKKLKTYFIIWLAAASINTATAQALQPPAIQCLQVQPTGDVDVNWLPTVDAFGSFIQYNIYSAQGLGGLYALAGTVPFLNASSYLHAFGGANTDQYAYYITTTYDDGSGLLESSPSDTLCTLYLEATPSSLPQGYALLNWDDPLEADNSNVPAASEYHIYMEYPAGVWTEILTMPYGVDVANYEITFCNEFLNFQVELVVPGLCNFIGNIDGDVFQDFLPPATPVVSSVSVNHITNDVELTWEVNSSSDTQAYIVYECENPGLSILDTLLGIANTQFVDQLANPSTAAECYLVAAFDTCYSGIPPSPNTSPTTSNCHCSIYLPSISYAICDDDISFLWTPYEGWPDGVDMYIIHHVFVADLLPPPTDAMFSAIDTVAGDVLNYTHLAIPLNGYNVYYIEAVGNFTNYRSISNLQSVYTPYPVDPAYIYLADVSVTAHNEIAVTVEVEPTIDVFDFTLEKFDVNGDNWDEVITESSSNSTTVTLYDYDVETDVFPFTYRIYAGNTCGDLTDTTNLGISILQQGFASTAQVKNILTWTPYGNWENGVQAYRVHRTIGDTGPDEVIAELSPSVFTYEDDVAVLLYTEGKFCYTIEAVEVPSTLLGISHSSYSNELCLSQEPKVWIPNAFVVDGFNETFRPVISFADFENYHMYIYTRWGDMIYHTTDINAPWNGTYEGTLVQEGEYAYFITVEDGKGRPFEYAGHVIMLSRREK
ncbi:MAG: gliding motility-associated C-terminal domain-containing protein [Flavobacteriales bacterium]